MGSTSWRSCGCTGRMWCVTRSLPTSSRPTRSPTRPPVDDLHGRRTRRALGRRPQCSTSTRWARLAEAAADHEGGVGELTLTFHRPRRHGRTERQSTWAGKGRPTCCRSRWTTSRRPECQRCSATSWSAPPPPPTSSPRMPERSTTNSRCWWSTECCTSSDTTTPRPNRPRRCAAGSSHCWSCYHWGGPAPGGFRQAQD